MITGGTLYFMVFLKHLINIEGKIPSVTSTISPELPSQLTLGI